MKNTNKVTLTIGQLKKLIKESKTSNKSLIKSVIDIMEEGGAETQLEYDDVVEFYIPKIDAYVKLTIEPSFPNQYNKIQPTFFIIDDDGTKVRKSIELLIKDVMREAYGHHYLSGPYDDEGYSFSLYDAIVGHPDNAKKLQIFFNKKYPNGLEWNKFKQVLLKLSSGGWKEIR